MRKKGRNRGIIRSSDHANRKAYETTSSIVKETPAYQILTRRFKVQIEFY
jgi:hypothetical protein